MGFWKNTFWAFTQTAEEKQKLAEFVENTKQQLQAETDADIARMTLENEQRLQNLVAKWQRSLDLHAESLIAGVTTRVNNSMQWVHPVDKRKKFAFQSKIENIFTRKYDSLMQRVHNNELNTANMLVGVRSIVYEILSGRKERLRQEADQRMQETGLKFDWVEREHVYMIFNLYEWEEREKKLQDWFDRVEKSNRAFQKSLNIFSEWIREKTRL